MTTNQAALLRAAKAIISASKKRKANPAPRLGTTKPKRKSQVTGKPPTKRLVKRRKENTVEGYFPNPSEVRNAHRGTGTVFDVLPYVVTTIMDKPIAGFPTKSDATKWMNAYAKRTGLTVKLFGD